MLMHALACLLWDRIENVSSVPGGQADSFVSFISGELLGVERDTKMESGLSALAQRLCSPSGEGGGGGRGVEWGDALTRVGAFRRKVVSFIIIVSLLVCAPLFRHGSALRSYALGMGHCKLG